MRRLLILLFMLAMPMRAAISRSGNCTAAAAACTLSAVNTGDLKVIWAVDIGSATIPSLPASFTNFSSATIGSGATQVSFRVYCAKAANAADTGTGTATNATLIASVAYTGTNVGTTGNCNTTGLGANGNASSASTSTLTCKGVALQRTNSTSWVACLAATSNSTGTPTCVPTGMNQAVGATSITFMDTNTGVASWADSGCAVTTETIGQRSIELIAQSSFVPQVGYTLPGP